MELRGQQDVYDVGPSFAQHSLQVVKDSGDSVPLLHGAGAIEIDVADGDGFDKLGNRFEGGSVAFRNVAGAKKRDAESLPRSYLA